MSLCVCRHCAANMLPGQPSGVSLHVLPRAIAAFLPLTRTFHTLGANAAARNPTGALGCERPSPNSTFRSSALAWAPGLHAGSAHRPALRQR